MILFSCNDIIQMKQIHILKNSNEIKSIVKSDIWVIY